MLLSSTALSRTMFMYSSKPCAVRTDPPSGQAYHNVALNARVDLLDEPDLHPRFLRGIVGGLPTVLNLRQREGRRAQRGRKAERIYQFNFIWQLIAPLVQRGRGISAGSGFRRARDKRFAGSGR